MGPTLTTIEYFLPKKILTNEDLAKEFGKDSQNIFKNTGILKRHIRNKKQIGSDLGFQAAKKLLKKNPNYLSKIDFLIFCSEGLDYKAPTTASVIHYRLGLNQNCGCIDMPMGCAGYVYGLSLSKSMILSNDVSCILFIAADIPTSVIHSEDFNMRSLFGDAGTATIIENSESGKIGNFVFGNDGSGAKNLCVERGSTRAPLDKEYLELHKKQVGNLAHGRMTMNGIEITRFSLEKVPLLLNETLKKNNLTFDEIDLFVFHQASIIILDSLKRKCKIPDSKFYVYLEAVGNTVSCTIPIALFNAEKENRLKRGDVVMLIGFGVGYSWGGTILHY
ncbi:MAG: 3-oxoacyl-ACP synthase III family protein [Bacteroidota bacterium]